MELTIREGLFPKCSKNLFLFASAAYVNHDEAHNNQHAHEVYHNAIIIATGEKFVLTEMEWKEFAYVMIGHDFLDYKIKKPAKTEAEIKKFYVTELNPESADKIFHIHANCSWSKRLSSTPLPIGQDWMRLLLQDSDWIEAMRVERAIKYAKSTMPTATDAEITAAVCKHIREKLLLVFDNLNFDSSRKLANSKGYHKQLLQFLNDNE